MPCNSDYLNQNPFEARMQNTAELLLYAIGELTHRGVSTNVNLIAVSPAATAYYAGDFGQVEELCKLINSLSDEDREAVVYNPHHVMGRRLAEWWEKHLEADRKREQQEADAVANATHRESALAKLTDDEKKALGL